jgi:hypothetical protein
MELQSSIERISSVECRVKVEIPWSEVSGRLDDKMRDIRRRARLPGFRPGKVPPNVIEKMYGKSIRSEVANDLVQETFQTAVAQHEATPLTQPVLESSTLESGKPFVYAARFEVPPAIEPKDYEGVPVRRRPAVADPKKIDAELAKRQEQLTPSCGRCPRSSSATRRFPATCGPWTSRDRSGTSGSRGRTCASTSGPAATSSCPGSRRRSPTPSSPRWAACGG